MLSDLILKRNQDVTPGNRSCLAGCVWKERKKRKRMEGKMNNCFRDYTGWSSWKQNRTWTWKVQKRMKESLVATGSSNTRTSVRPHIPLPHSSKKKLFYSLVGKENNGRGIKSSGHAMSNTTSAVGPFKEMDSGIIWGPFLLVSNPTCTLYYHHWYTLLRQWLKRNVSLLQGPLFSLSVCVFYDIGCSALTIHFRPLPNQLRLYMVYPFSSSLLCPLWQLLLFLFCNDCLPDEDCLQN